MGVRQSMHLSTDLPRLAPASRLSGWKMKSMRQRETLLDLAVNEFMEASLFSLVAANIIVAQLTGRIVQLAGPADVYLPCPPTVLPRAIPALASLGVSSDILKSLHAFHARAAFAVRFTGPGFAQLSRGVAVQNGNLAAERELWNGVCGAALLAVHFLYEEERFPNEAQEQNVRLIRDSIKAIGNGDTPFVRSDSTVFIPGWLDYRRDVRVACGWRIEIRHQGASAPGVLENISRTGMGLVTNVPMVPSQTVSVALPDGRQLDGTVVWADGQRCGVTFPRPLDERDFLLPAHA
jgi:hypothetical protein